MAARPPRRVPRTSLDETAGHAVALAPAPDNGVPYGSRGTKAARPGRQLGQRIPTELYDRLVECSEATGISQQRLIVRGIDEELKRHDH